MLLDTARTRGHGIEEEMVQSATSVYKKGEKSASCIQHGLEFQECHVFVTPCTSATASQLSGTSVTEGKYPNVVTLVPHRQLLYEWSET